MTADNWATLLLIGVNLGWVWLYRREARRAEHCRHMLVHLLTAVEDAAQAHAHVHVQRKCVCDEQWLTDGEEVLDGQTLHGRYMCGPAREVL